MLVTLSVAVRRIRVQVPSTLISQATTQQACHPPQLIISPWGMRFSAGRALC